MLAAWLAAWMDGSNPVTIDLSPSVVATVTTAAVTIIASIATAVVKILREIRDTKQEIRTTKYVAAETQRAVVQNARIGQDAGNERDRKLDQITILVDGRYSDVLTQLATVLQSVATQSGIPADQHRADAARGEASAQDTRVRDARSTPPGPPGPKDL